MKRRTVLGMGGLAMSSLWSLIPAAGSAATPTQMPVSAVLFDPRYAASKQLAAQAVNAQRFVVQDNAVEVWRSSLLQHAAAKNFRLDALTSYSDYLVLKFCLAECGQQVEKAEAVQYVSRNSVVETRNLANPNQSAVGAVTLWRWSAT